jgi:DNA polymerase-3 subunit epsilon
MQPRQPFLDPQTPIESLPLAFLDLETTGLAAARGDRMVEICVRRMRGTTALPELELNTLVQPGRSVPPEVSRIHGLDDAALVDAPPEAQVVRLLPELLAGAIIVAHNAPFDLSFIDDALHRHGLPAPVRPTIDTLTFSRRLWPAPDLRHTLAALAQRLRVRNPAPHRAHGDVQVLIAAWPLLLSAARREVELHSYADLQDYLSS